MTSEKRVQKFHTDDASLPRSGWCFWLVESNFSRGMTNQKHYPDQDSDTSSVWNFCTCFPDVINLEGKPLVAAPNVSRFLRQHEIGHELREIVRLTTKLWDLASLNLTHIPKSLLILSIIFVSNIKMEGSSCWCSQISKSISIITRLSWWTCPCQLIIFISVKRLFSRWWMIAEQVNVIGL